MKKIIIGLMALFLSSASFAAESISLKATVSLSSAADFDEDFDLTEWKKSEDQYGDAIYTLEKIVKISELPYEASLGPAYIEINKSGVVGTGVSIGDDDAGAEGSLALPKNAGAFVKLSGLKLNVSGGDYASGAWSYESSVEITVN